MISVMPRILKDDPTAQEFVNELNIAEDYKEPAKRKYDEKSFYLSAFCRLLLYSGSLYFRFGSGNGEKDGINDWKKNQRNETGSRNVTGTACRSIVYEEMHDFCI